MTIRENDHGKELRLRRRSVRRENDHGSVAAEAIIAVPVLLLILVVATIVIYRTVATRLRLDDAAHQAARAASLATTPAGAEQAARSTARSALNGGLCLSTDVAVATGAWKPGGSVTVTITCRVHLADAPAGIPDTATLSASSSSPLDRWRTTTAARGD